MHNTGNPLGSNSVLDLYDNSETIDNFVNSQQDEVPDRFGTKRLTLAALTKRSMTLRNEINDFSGALTFKPEWSDVPMNVSEGVGGEGGALNLQAEALGNRGEINKITSREALRRTYQEVGLNLVEGSFEQGAVISSTTDVVLHEKTGKCYSGPIGVVPKGTNPLSDGYVDKTNVLLRNVVIGEFSKPKYQTHVKNHTNAIRGDMVAYQSLLPWDSKDIEEDKYNSSDSVYYRFPQILKLPSGALIIVTTTMHGSNKDVGQSSVGQYDLTVKWSFNNGATWVNKKIVAQFGPTYQNTDACLFYDQSRDRIWCFFTSCKGVTGVGHSQAGTTDPDYSSQVYYTYSNGESNSWTVPVNITSAVKPDTAQFFGVSNGKGFTFIDGKLAIPMFTYNSGNMVTIHFLEFDPSTDKFRLFDIDTGSTGGEQTLTLLPSGVILSTARGLPLAGKGQQKFFYSSDGGRSWERDFKTIIQTTEVKGDITILNDYYEGRPTYVFVAANGSSNSQNDRNNLTVWYSNNLVDWTIAPVSVYNTYVGYVSCVSGTQGDEIIIASEAGGLSGIFFHSCSLRYVSSRTRAHAQHGILSSFGNNASLLIAAGAIRNRDFFFDSKLSALCFVENGNYIPVCLFDPVLSISADINSPNVSGKSIIQIDGACVLRGFSGGFVGQRVTVVSTSSQNICQMVRLSTSVPGNERFFYDLSGSLTILHVGTNLQQSVDFIKTNYGWVTSAKANK